jgi:Pyruvate/2-oxoacid:ferredoxin oxidoreductase gamma subunit
MSDKGILNIIISGTGGQGVLTLSNMLRKLALSKGLKCEGATFKGGAQRMGSVYAELRILLDPQSKAYFSSQIPNYSVDVLIGMEPWEALRFANRCNTDTLSIINSEEEKLYVERYEKTEMIDPIQTLIKVYKSPIIKNYSQLSKELNGSSKFTNYLMLHEAIQKEYVPFSMEELIAIKTEI